MSIPSISWSKVLPLVPYTKSPLDVPLLQKAWCVLDPKKASSSLGQIALKILRFVVAALLTPFWVPVYIYSLTIGNILVKRKNDWILQNTIVAPHAAHTGKQGSLCFKIFLMALGLSVAAALPLLYMKSRSI